MCEADLLNIILWTKNALDIIYILVPILMIIFISIDLGKIVIGKTEDSSKILATCTKRIIAGLVIFFIPLITSVLLDLVSYSTTQKAFTCWKEATPENVEIKLKEERAKEKAEREIKEKEQEEKRKKKAQERKDKSARAQKEYLSKKEQEEKLKSGESAVNIPSKGGSLAPIINGTQRALKTGECMKFSDNCACPAIGRFSGFYFTMASSTGRNMKETKMDSAESIEYLRVNCSDGSHIHAYVNSKVKSNFNQAFEKVCELRKKGTIATFGGAYYARTNSSRTICSFHAYGSAVDFNYSLSITVNGNKYKPYANQGSSTYAEYNRFVKALGKENHPKNYNYILWKEAFEPAGFEWGGNWSAGSFDPMHFEIK